MDGNCETCEVEKYCIYEYKPCDCCNHRKFKPKETTLLEHHVKGWLKINKDNMLQRFKR